MFIIPARIEFLNIEGDSLESVYTLRIEADFLPHPRYVGSFDNFYSLGKLLENPESLVEFLNKEEGLDGVVREMLEFGADIDGRFYEAEEFQEDSTED